MECRIIKAIEEATKLRFDDYCVKSNYRELVWARRIYIYNCKRCNIKHIYLAERLHTSESAISKLYFGYTESYKTNEKFKSLADNINRLIKTL